MRHTHTEQLKYYAKIGEYTKAISHLKLVAEHAIGFVSSRNDNIITSLVFRGKDNGSRTGSSSDNDAAQLLKKLDDNVFDRTRESAEFSEIKANLNAYVEKWQEK